MHTSKTAVACVALTCTVAASQLIAGPLNPPVGPVSSTSKTLSEVEPRVVVNATNTPGDADSLFKITQPGSYYLAGNITGVVGKHGIEIAASGVTLDLSGFDLAGVSGMGSFDGVVVTAFSLRNVTVRNGSVRNWGREGVSMGSLFPAPVSSAVIDIRASGNVGTGIFGGVGSIISGCTAALNGVAGIRANDGCTISECVANSNTGVGIVAGNACMVISCSAVSNDSHGISALSGSTIRDCTSQTNLGDGIRVSAQCLIVGNACISNGFTTSDGAGIHATGADNRIQDNACTLSDRGIDVDVAGNLIIKNSCSGNTVNWDIAANNVCGPILDRTAPASAAISGNSAPDSTGSTHPNANFTY